jgi:hypothetical protein
MLIIVLLSIIVSLRQFLILYFTNIPKLFTFGG